MHEDEITVTVPVEESAPEIVEGGDAVVIVAPAEPASEDAPLDALLAHEQRITALEMGMSDLNARVAETQFVAAVAEAEAEIAAEEIETVAEEVPEIVSEEIEGAPVAQNEDGELEVMPDTPPATHGPGFLFASRDDWRKRRENNR